MQASLALSPAARRVVAAVAALGVSGACDAINDEIAHRAGLGNLTLRLALIELEVRGVISMEFVPGRGRSLALVGRAAEAA